MEKKTDDLVVSYVVTPNGNVLNYDALTTALENGYRVIDVITNSMSVGGGGNSIGDVVVTVILNTLQDSASEYRRHFAT
jgi:hypothetical protein